MLESDLKSSSFRSCLEKWPLAFPAIYRLNMVVKYGFVLVNVCFDAHCMVNHPNHI